MEELLSISSGLSLRRTALSKWKNLVKTQPAVIDISIILTTETILRDIFIHYIYIFYAIYTIFLYSYNILCNTYFYFRNRHV